MDRTLLCTCYTAVRFPDTSMFYPGLLLLCTFRRNSIAFPNWGEYDESEKLGGDMGSLKTYVLSQESGLLS